MSVGVLKKTIFLILALSITAAALIAVKERREANKRIVFLPYGRDVPDWSPFNFYPGLKELADEKGYHGVWLDLNGFPKRHHYLKRLTNFLLSKNQGRIFVFYNYNSYLSKSKIGRLPRGKRILMMWEPPSVLLDMYREDVQQLFDRIYTWNDDLVDGERYFKICNGDLRPMEQNLPPFEERKLLCMIASNYKFNDFKEELYSARRELVSFFDSQEEGLFDLYGRLWEGHRNAKGRVADKLETLKQYKFNICFENTKQPGYITEKIFDCFVTGTIPIYYGATNIEAFIPPECYIDYRQFRSREEMVTAIQNISKEEYQEYLAQIRTFLESEQALQFHPATLAKTILEAIEM